MSFVNKKKRRIKRFVVIVSLLILAFVIDTALFFLKKFKKVIFFPGN